MARSRRLATVAPQVVPTFQVTFSGQSYDEISGGSFWQTERLDIATKFHSRRRGLGYQMFADLSAEDAEDLERELRMQADLLFSGGSDDDARYAAIGRKLVADADRIKQAIKL